MALCRCDHHVVCFHADGDEDDGDDDGDTKRGKADPSSRRARYDTVQV